MQATLGLGSMRKIQINMKDSIVLKDSIVPKDSIVLRIMYIQTRKYTITLDVEDLTP